MVMSDIRLTFPLRGNDAGEMKVGRLKPCEDERQQIETALMQVMCALWVPGGWTDADSIRCRHKSAIAPNTIAAIAGSVCHNISLTCDEQQLCP
jgi:hypothetical protein